MKLFQFPTSTLLVLFVAITLITNQAQASVEITQENGVVLRGDRIEPTGDPTRIRLIAEATGIRIERLVSLLRIRSIRIGDIVVPVQDWVESGSEPTRTYSVGIADVELDPTKDDRMADGRVDQSLVRPLAMQDEPLHFVRPGFVIPFAMPLDSIPLDARVISVRDDPLNAYTPEVAQYYPDGIPLSEIPVALEAMRTRKFREIVESIPPGIRHDAVPRNEIPIPQKPILPNPISRRSPVRGIFVTATPVRWNGKVDVDSLAVEIVAVDAAGHPVPVDGTAEISLWTVEQQLELLNPNQFLFDYPSRRAELVVAHPGRLRKLQTWTRNIHPVGTSSRSEATSGSLILPLPESLPDHSLNVASPGSLHVKLSVPGQGVFEATEPAVGLRQQSPLRELNTLQNGSRFLPGEGTFGRKRKQFVPFSPSPYSRPFNIFTPQQLQNNFAPANLAGSTTFRGFSGTVEVDGTLSIQP